MTWEQQLGSEGKQIDDTLSSQSMAIIELQNKNIALTNENLRLQAIIDAGGPVDPPPVDPPVDPPTSGKLKWRPPGLVNPVVIDMNKGQTIPSSMDVTKDYEIILRSDAPVVRSGTGLQLIGGKSIRIIGGEVVVSPSGGVCRAVYAKDNKGTVHIEGVKFRSSTGTFTEGINNSSADSIFQIENCHVEGLCSGSQSSNHADILQTWNGPKSLRVDGLKGRTNYQAAFLNARDTNAAAAPASDWELHRCDFESVNGKYTLWLVPPPASVKTSKVHCWGPSLGELKPEMWPGILHKKPTEDMTWGACLSYVLPGYLSEFQQLPS